MFDIQTTASAAWPSASLFVPIEQNKELHWAKQCSSRDVHTSLQVHGPLKSKLCNYETGGAAGQVMQG